jgi:hypothetical protein
MRKIAVFQEHSPVDELFFAPIRKIDNLFCQKRSFCQLHFRGSFKTSRNRTMSNAIEQQVTKNRLVSLIFTVFLSALFLRYEIFCSRFSLFVRFPGSEKWQQKIGHRFYTLSKVQTDEPWNSPHLDALWACPRAFPGPESPWSFTRSRQQAENAAVPASSFWNSHQITTISIYSFTHACVSHSFAL